MRSSDIGRVAIVWDEPTDQEGVAWWRYAVEVLDHLRLPFRRLAADGLDVLPDEAGVLLVAGGIRLSETARRRLADWTAAGGALITVGDPGDLADLLGVAATSSVDHDHVRISPGPQWTAAPDVALHAIGGRRLTTSAADTETLATWESDGSPAITTRTVGGGTAICFGADVWQSIVRIQQGYPVSADGAPAADGTAPIDDGILKCEDGMALDFDRDRALPPGEPEVPADYTHTYPPPAAVPMFHRPVADLWRSVLLQALWWAAERSEVPVAWLHYWPAGIPAIAHMSHDSDQNITEHGKAALEAFDEADVKVTWCQVFPGGYDTEIYRQVTEAGHEHALHYNAMADADIATWGWPQMRAQYAWAQAITGLERIVSNKNHYTRWEGWIDFYLWCERLGIEIDESRGPSKQGTIGFPFGTAHVSFPMADSSLGNRFLDVLNLPLHTQDLAWAGHEANRDVILDQALEQHGIAHFLFHGPHLHLRPATRAACPALAAEARRRGMEWWTAGRINQWERLRRTVTLTITPDSAGWVVRTTSPEPVSGAGILLLLPGREDGAPTPRLQTGDGALDTVVRHGREFVELAVDIPAGEASWTLAP